MKTTVAPFPSPSRSLLLGSGSGCSILTDQEINYDVTPQELAQDLSKAFNGETGSFPTVDCTASSSLCTMIPGTLPPTATVTCDASTATPSKSACALHYDLTLHPDDQPLPGGRASPPP